MKKEVMKRLIFTSLLCLTSFGVLSAPTALDQLKMSPSVICKDHAEKQQCMVAIQATMVAVYNITSLSEHCESTAEAQKSKMNGQLKEQCAAAKEITDYLKSQTQ